MPGHPQLGTNPIIGIDAVNFTVSDAQGASTLVIAQNPVPPASAIFTLGVTVQFDGAFALWIMSLGVPFTVTFFGGSLDGPAGGAPFGPPQNITTTAGNLSYTVTTNVDPNSNPAGSGNPIAPGAYKLTAVVSFSSAATPPPLAAFADGPIIDIFV